MSHKPRCNFAAAFMMILAVLAMHRRRATLMDWVTPTLEAVRMVILIAVCPTLIPILPWLSFLSWLNFYISFLLSPIITMMTAVSVAITVAPFFSIIIMTSSPIDIVPMSAMARNFIAFLVTSIVGTLPVIFARILLTIAHLGVLSMVVVSYRILQIEIIITASRFNFFHSIQQPYSFRRR